jgi:hypothetical protein
MNFYYIFLLLLVVLSAYSESPQQGEPPDSLDSTSVAVCPNSSSDPLGVLAPVLPQSWVFEFILPQNEGFGSVLQNGVFKIVLPQNWVFGVVLSPIEVNITVLPQNWVFNNVISNCQLSNKVENTVNSLLNIGDESVMFLSSAVIHSGEKLAWTIRILLECLQHVLKMYAWSLSENQASIQFKCRLIGLMVKQSLFRKHDWVHQIYHEYQNWCFWQLKKYSNNSHTHITEECFDNSTRYHFYGGGKALIFSFDELHPYAYMSNSISFFGVSEKIINRACLLTVVM